MIHIIKKNIMHSTHLVSCNCVAGFDFKTNMVAVCFAFQLEAPYDPRRFQNQPMPFSFLNIYTHLYPSQLTKKIR